MICDYLSNRKQYVFTNGFQSKNREITCGVPQGSILGPLLFVIYINDVYLASSYFHTTVYADDTSLFSSGDNLRELIDKTETEFKKVYLWFCTNRLMLNVKKTTCVIFHPINKATSNLSPYIRLINNDIPISNYAKFLGVIIDKNLTWYDHIHYISGKISKGVGILSKLKYMLPMSILKLIYNAIISPYISYCNIVWGGTYSSRLNSIRVLQNRAIRIISGNDESLHTPQLYYKTNCLNLFDIHKFQVGLFMHSWSTNKLPFVFKNYFSYQNKIHPHYTRSANNISYPCFRLSSSQEHVLFSGPKIWNAMPAYLIEIKELNNFKHKFTLLLHSKYK